jgi:hypothetical protein
MAQTVSKGRFLLLGLFVLALVGLAIPALSQKPATAAVPPAMDDEVVLPSRGHRPDGVCTRPFGVEGRRSAVRLSSRLPLSPGRRPRSHPSRGKHPVSRPTPRPGGRSHSRPLVGAGRPDA